LTVILFELFSGTDPFPGSVLQIFRAKQHDEVPEIPLEFPDALKNLIRNGWSKKPRERPEIKEFRSALSLILNQEEDKSCTGQLQVILTFVRWLRRDRSFCRLTFFRNLLFSIELHSFKNQVRVGQLRLGYGMLGKVRRPCKC
jgi:hypothetical protein